MEFSADFANWNSILGRAGRDEEPFNRLLQGLIAQFESVGEVQESQTPPRRGWPSRPPAWDCRVLVSKGRREVHRPRLDPWRGVGPVPSNQQVQFRSASPGPRLREIRHPWRPSRTLRQTTLRVPEREGPVWFRSLSEVGRQRGNEDRTQRQGADRPLRKSECGNITSPDIRRRCSPGWGEQLPGSCRGWRRHCRPPSRSG